MIYRKHIDIDEVVSFTADLGPDTKIYLGCDSERLRIDEVWYADYISVVAVHVNGNNGCKIFGAVQRERDFDQRVDKPRMRLMNEVYRVSDLYLRLVDKVPFEVFVHLDINPNEMHRSSIVVNEAVGYVKGMCGVIPFVKPNSWAASYGADRWKEIVGHRRVA
jgi:predicted RNase H-related nuclease YkuK (DUF458 family)